MLLHRTRYSRYIPLRLHEKYNIYSSSQHVDQQGEKMADVFGVAVPNYNNVKKSFDEKLQNYHEIGLELRDFYKLYSTRVAKENC